MENYSVLMTVYIKDNPHFIKQSIDSIYNQTYRTNDFVLICDGEITVEQESLVSYYQKEFENFHVIRLPQNVGLGVALKTGLTYCVNELVARMDNDDIALHERCESQVKFMMQNPEVAIVGSPVIEFDSTPESPIRIKKVPLSNEEIKKFSRRRNPFNHSTVMLRKSKIMSVGSYNDMRTNQDVELWVRTLNNGFIGANLSKPLVYFRFDENTYKRRKTWKNVNLLINVWKDFLKNRYCNLFDFLVVLFTQLAIFLMPTFLLKWVYNRFR